MKGSFSHAELGDLPGISGSHIPFGSDKNCTSMSTRVHILSDIMSLLHVRPIFHGSHWSEVYSRILHIYFYVFSGITSKRNLLTMARERETAAMRFGMVLLCSDVSKIESITVPFCGLQCLTYERLDLV